MRRKDYSPKHSYTKNQYSSNTQQPPPSTLTHPSQKTYPEPVLELIGAITKKLQNKFIQHAENKSEQQPIQNQLSVPVFSFESPLMNFKEFVCYLKETGGCFEESTLWRILKITIYSCAAMEDCFLCFDDFDVNCFGIFQSEEGFDIKIKHLFNRDEGSFDDIDKLDRLIGNLPVEWRREDIIFDSINRTAMMKREIGKSINSFLGFLKDFNYRVKKCVRSVFGLLLRISIYEFERDNDNKMRILKSQLLSMLQERGYSELFIKFAIGILFTKDINSISTFCELRNKMETGGFNSKGSFESFSSHNIDFYEKGVKHLKWTTEKLGSNFSFLVNNYLKTWKIEYEKPQREQIIEISKKQNSPVCQKRLLKNKSSDESFNYQSYLMRMADQHPEISEIMQNKRIDNIMQNSEDGDTLNSLASYLRKGDFGLTENKAITKIKSGFNKHKDNDTLNLTLEDKKPFEVKKQSEESNNSDIELSGLHVNKKEETTNYNQLISNINSELKVDEELDFINKKINNLKLRIQKHKKELKNKNEGNKKLLTDVTDLKNNSHKEKSPIRNRVCVNSPNQTNTIRYRRPLSIAKESSGLRVSRTRALSITGGSGLENRYIRYETSNPNHTILHKNVHGTSFESNPGFHKRSVSSNERGYGGRFGKGSGISERRIIRGDSRSSSLKRRIKLESVDKNFFKDLVSKDFKKESYDNYYLN